MSHLMNTLIHSVIPGSPVLFSGGLDSTLIAAALALSGAPEVELINFCALDTAPDRASSRASLVDLQRSFPNTKFTLHEYTGDILEMANERSLIKSLLVPTSVTEMNLNIAMTLYSALKHSNSSIVHSGLGADELCCGYMRMKEGATADAEIVEHMNRLWTRNGGRDDRVAMHLGKVCICPFLSKKFIEAASKLPVEMLIKEDLPRGCGEKWILRKIAEKYGLKQAAERPKQAMQFGSKVAKAKWRGDEEIPES